MPVPAQENEAAVLRERGHKAAENSAQFPGIQLLLRAVVGNALCQLLGEADQIRPALGGVVPIQPPKGDVAADPTEERVQEIRLLGRNGIPGLQVCIINAFPRILRGTEDPLGKAGQLSAVNRVRFPNRAFVPIPV